MTSKEEANYHKVCGLINRNHANNSEQFTDEELKTFFGATDLTVKNIREDELRTTTNLKVLSLDDLKNYEVPEYDWRVSKILQDKKILVVSGSSAVYKSWLCLNLALCVSKGVPFLGNFSTEQTGVLFIDKENSIPELQNRVNMLCTGLKIEENENLPIYFISEQEIKLDSPQDRKFLDKFIRINNIGVVIVDTYRRVIEYEENNADYVSRFFTDELKPLCNKTGASFVLIHHHKKGGKQGDSKEMLRGSSDLVNFVDGILQIERRGAKLTISQTKNRSCKELSPFSLRIDTDEENYFTFQYEGEKEEIGMVGRCVEALLYWIGKEKIAEFETKEAMKISKEAGIKRSNFYEGLAELEKRGLIEKIAQGKYKVLENNRDFGESPMSIPIRNGQLDKLSPNKSNIPKSPIGQVGLIGLTKKNKKKTNKLIISNENNNNSCIICKIPGASFFINDKPYCRSCQRGKNGGK